MAAETRLSILQSFQANGLFIDKEALSVLSEYITSIKGSSAEIRLLLESCQAGQTLLWLACCISHLLTYNSAVVSPAADCTRNNRSKSSLDATDESLKIGKSEALDLVSRQQGSSRHIEYIQVISAFEVPRIKFDPIRKAFYREERACSIFAEASVSYSLLLL